MLLLFKTLDAVTRVISTKQNCAIIFQLSLLDDLVLDADSRYLQHVELCVISLVRETIRKRERT